MEKMDGMESSKFHRVLSKIYFNAFYMTYLMYAT
jgi:hypothetical protein